MTIPANLNLEAAPYGAQPVVIVVGAQGGPYNVVDATHGIPVTLVGGGGGATTVQGDTAAGLADGGAPVKIGGLVSSVTPAGLTTGQRVNAWYGVNGQLIVSPCIGAQIGDTSVGRYLAALDGATTSIMGVAANLWDDKAGVWNRRRNNVESTLLASAARTVTVQSADQVNYNGKRLLLIVDVSVVGTGSITPSLQVKDPVSGNYATVWTAAAAIVTAGTFTYLFEGGSAGGSFTERLAFGLPARTWRLVVTHNNANTITYSASANVGV